MFKVYIYALNTLADWELGYVTAELNSGRFFKRDAPEVSVKTVAISREPVKTMGGLTMVPGANTWDDPKHSTIIKKAGELLSVGGMVCAICGATVALANAGLLDQRLHTSNGAGYLEMVSPAYKGQKFFLDAPSVADRNLITASSSGALLWSKQIIEQLDVFQHNTLEAWYAYFCTGQVQHFFALMQTLPDRKQE